MNEIRLDIDDANVAIAYLMSVGYVIGMKDDKYIIRGTKTLRATEMTEGELIAYARGYHDKAWLS